MIPKRQTLTLIADYRADKANKPSSWTIGQVKGVRRIGYCSQNPDNAGLFVTPPRGADSDEHLQRNENNSTALQQQE